MMLYSWMLLLFGSLVCVLAALVTLCKLQWARSGKCFAYAFTLFVLANIILPLPPDISRISSRTACAANLSQISLACDMYTQYHNEEFPPSFRSLHSLTNYFSNDPKVFICPYSGNKPGPIETVDEWTDYILVTNLNATTNSNLVLVYCKPENHKNGEVYSILLTGFYLKRISPKDFGKLSCDIAGHSRINNRPQQLGPGCSRNAAQPDP